MTENQAENLINKGRLAFEAFIECKDQFTVFAADYFNLDADKSLTQGHFIGANEGLDLETFKEAFAAMIIVLQSDAVKSATRPVYQMGRQ